MTALDILTRQDLAEFKEELFSEIQKLITVKPEARPNKWLHTREVRKMLGISAGTLQTFKVNGTSAFSKIGNIPYYKLEDINNILLANSSIPRRTNAK